MNKKIVLVGIVALVIALTGGTYFLNSAQTKRDDTKIHIVEVFKSPSCGCCNGYIAALESDGFQVKSVNMDDLTAIKNKYNIPTEMQSCHTTIIGRYFIEGHVPLDAVKKLLQEQPDIDGIALPGMPIGTPGMPGPKESPFVIYQIKDGQSSEFMKI
jgi:hypothetical protein